MIFKIISNFLGVNFFLTHTVEESTIFLLLLTMRDHYLSCGLDCLTKAG